jgi:uncharacterized membrane protein (Fun14 family)
MYIHVLVSYLRWLTLDTETITSVSATLGGGFFGGLLFGYAIKKVVKLIAVIAN